MIMAYSLWGPQIQNLRKLEYCKKVQYSRLKASHSNQLINPKHLQKVPEPLNGLSVWFSGIHNHGEDCWPYTCAENHHWHPPHAGKASKGNYKRSRMFSKCCTSIERQVEGKSVEEKGAQAAGMTAAWRGLSRKGHLKVWRSFTLVDWGWSQPIKSHHEKTDPGHGLQLSYSSCQASPEQ